jgi:hypothetical protein
VRLLLAFVWGICTGKGRDITARNTPITRLGFQGVVPLVDQDALAIFQSLM